jgi:hypothetical protein
MTLLDAASILLLMLAPTSCKGEFAKGIVRNPAPPVMTKPKTHAPISASLTIEHPAAAARCSDRAATDWRRRKEDKGGRRVGAHICASA